MLSLAEALYVGGREEVMLVEAKYLDRERFEPVVGVLSDKTGPVAAELRAAGVEVVSLGRRTHRFSPGLLRAVLRLARERGIDLIHAHDYKAALYARLAARGRLPVAYTVHYSYEGRAGKRNLINRLLAPWTCAVIGVSEAACEAIRRRDGLPRGLVHCLTNAIDPERLEAGRAHREDVRRELGCGPEAVLFATVCRLEAAKGLPYLIDALGSLHENCRAVLVGSGPEEAALRDRAQRLGLEGRVVFAGMRRDVGRLLAGADCFVLPSLDESFGLALAEAMYLELPVVATAVGGIGTLVAHGEQGLLVPPNDAAALARAMGQIVSEIAAAPERAREMGRAGRRRVEERFMPRHHLAGLEALYEAALMERAMGRARRS